MAQYIYARISKDELNHDNQIHTLIIRFPDAEIVKETIGGAAKVKPTLNALIGRLQPGDTLAIYALDRVSRRGGEAIVLLRSLLDRGVKVYSHREQFDFTTPIGEFMSGQMLLFAQLERRLIGERTRNTLARLKAEGKKLGRPKKDLSATIQTIMGYRQQGLTIKQIHQQMGLSTGRICQLLKSA